MFWTVLIVLHAAAGFVALGTGVPAMRRGWLLPAHLWALVATIVPLAGAVAVDWAGLDTAARILFVAFVGLGGYLIWSAVRALRRRPAPSERPSPAYVRHLGFNLVALTDAFLVILVLDLGVPVAGVVATGVAAAVAGHFVLVRVERLLTRPRAETVDLA